MKTISTLLFTIAIFFTSQLTAQTTIEITEAVLPMSKGNYNAFVVDIPQTKVNDLKKEWDSYIKKSGRRIKTGDYKGEHFALEVQVASIGNLNYNIYSNFIQTITGVKVATHFQVQDSFVSTLNNEFAAKSISAYLHEFTKEAYAKAVNNELDLEKSVLKKLDDELHKLYTNKDKLTNQINDNKNSISKTETEINIKKNEQQLKDKSILMQREKMVGVSLNPAEKKLQEKIISDLNKEKRSLIKDEQRLRKDIQKYEADIKKIERNVAKYDSDVAIKLSTIEKQRQIIQNIENKLKDIRRL
jgi:predicted  nucleic acid-binding Zn-ribbon protein